MSSTTLIARDVAMALQFEFPLKGHNFLRAADCKPAGHGQPFLCQRVPSQLASSEPSPGAELGCGLQ